MIKPFTTLLDNMCENCSHCICKDKQHTVKDDNSQNGKKTPDNINVKYKALEQIPLYPYTPKKP